MKKKHVGTKLKVAFNIIITFLFIASPYYIGLKYESCVAFAADSSESTISISLPAPLLEKGKQPVDWWFIFKFNGSKFPGCGSDAERTCIFDKDREVSTKKPYSQQFVYASSADSSLKEGRNCLGMTIADPVGATFDQVYNNDSYYFVIWNDQFYNHPPINDPKCKITTRNKGGNCFAPWGHSKGMLAWDRDGNGFVMQVTTPSWPGSGSSLSPRKNDGNTLGCVEDNNIKFSQHFFALRLSPSDVLTVLKWLANASVVTDTKNKQLVKNGGPDDIQKQVRNLGEKINGDKMKEPELLSTGVKLIAKPSGLNVPPWQMVSAYLGGESLKTATWWDKPKIHSTKAVTDIECWDDSLGKPGPVEIALSGQWNNTNFALDGGIKGSNHNHAKIGISTSDKEHNYVIFGDLNQQGALTGNCSSSQNGRGGLFFVLDNKALHDSVENLIKGETDPAIE